MLPLLLLLPLRLCSRCDACGWSGKEDVSGMVKCQKAAVASRTPVTEELEAEYGDREAKS